MMWSLSIPSIILLFLTVLSHVAAKPIAPKPVAKPTTPVAKPTAPVPVPVAPAPVPTNFVPLPPPPTLAPVPIQSTCSLNACITCQASGVGVCSAYDLSLLSSYIQSNIAYAYQAVGLIEPNSWSIVQNRRRFLGEDHRLTEEESEHHNNLVTQADRHQDKGVSRDLVVPNCADLCSIGAAYCGRFGCYVNKARRHLVQDDGTGGKVTEQRELQCAAGTADLLQTSLSNHLYQFYDSLPYAEWIDPACRDTFWYPTCSIHVF